MRAAADHAAGARAQGEGNETRGSSSLNTTTRPIPDDVYDAGGGGADSGNVDPNEDLLAAT